MRDEEARRRAESERVEAERARVEAEEVRQAQEGSGETEVSRVDAETVRDDAEISRDAAEEERARVSLSRREAEKERVAAEESRQDAEQNGREVAEVGRVEAEEARVAAEKKRSGIRLFYLKIAAAIALPMAFVALLPAGVGIYLVIRENERLDREIERRCDDARLNRTAIRDTVLNSFASLGYRYDVKTQTAVEVGGEIAYYVEHPEERARALESALATVKRFPPVSC